jgi:hypothetical protein
MNNEQDQTQTIRQEDETDSSKKQSVVVVKTTQKTKAKKPDNFTGIEPEKGLKALITEVIRKWRAGS